MVKNVRQRTNRIKSRSKERVQKLTEDFLKVIEQGKKDKYNEERVKITYVLPFLEALGWNPRTDEILPEQTTLTSLTPKT
jgi:predicted type IV restriction endonuclease